jgi:ribosome maturation protein Sdo1
MGGHMREALQDKEIARGYERRKMLSESKREMVNYLSRKK